MEFGISPRGSSLPISSFILFAAGVVGCGAPAEPPIPASRCRLASPILSTGRLRTDGTRLRDELGRVVALRGFNSGSRSKFAPYAPFDFTGDAYDAALASYLDRAAAWGVDVLRVPFNWAAVEPARGMDDEEFLRRYDALVDQAWKRGIRTIVDFHQDVYAEAFCGDGFPAWTIPGNPPAPHHDCARWFENYADPAVSGAFDRFWAEGSPVQADYVAMWQRLIARHRDRAGVIGFEPMNEPSAGSANEKLFEATTLTQFHSKMAALINGMAPLALVFVDPPGVTSATHITSLGKVSGANLVYAPHYYQTLTIFDGDGRPDLVADELRQVIAPQTDWNVPAFLGEWGAARDVAGSADLVAAHHTAFDALGISGAQWEYSISKEAWNKEALDVANPDGTPNPMVAGMLRPHARAVAGDAVAVDYSRDTREFTLRYTPDPTLAADNISEIAVPSDPNDIVYAVEVSGGCFDDSALGRILIRSAGPGEVKVKLAPASH